MISKASSEVMIGSYWVTSITPDSLHNFKSFVERAKCFQRLQSFYKSTQLNTAPLPHLAGRDTNNNQNVFDPRSLQNARVLPWNWRSQLHGE